MHHLDEVVVADDTVPDSHLRPDQLAVDGRMCLRYLQGYFILAEIQIEFRSDDRFSVLVLLWCCQLLAILALWRG